MSNVVSSVLAGRRVRGNERRSLPDTVPRQVSGADRGMVAGVSGHDVSPGMGLAEGTLPGGGKRTDGIPVCEAAARGIWAEKERSAAGIRSGARTADGAIDAGGLRAEDDAERGRRMDEGLPGGVSVVPVAVQVHTDAELALYQRGSGADLPRLLPVHGWHAGGVSV